MRLWVDLSNSPHVALFRPIVAHLAERGDSVLLTARDHAQTRELARRHFEGIVVVGGPSPAGRAAKAGTIGARVAALARLAAGQGVDVALSHGSYAQIAAARALGIPAVTMMDYEFQPANHLAFRLAQRVIVPRAFPGEALRRFGAGRKALRYAGYKEELYLAGFSADASVLEALGIDPGQIVAVLRPPPEGALYHRTQNPRFLEVARRVVAHPETRAVLLARTAERAAWAELLPGALVPPRPVDGPSLLGAADLTVGAGGTMNRESALLGTPTYTVFAGRLAAVDAALIREGRLVDLRPEGTEPVVAKRSAGATRGVPASRRAELLGVLDAALDEVARPRSPGRALRRATSIDRRTRERSARTPRSEIDTPSGRVAAGRAASRDAGLE